MWDAVKDGPSPGKMWDVVKNSPGNLGAKVEQNLIYSVKSLARMVRWVRKREVLNRTLETPKGLGA